MHNTGAQKAEQYAKNHHRRSLWQRIVGGLACVVVFITTYVLILPAITLGKTAYCGHDEHHHDKNCYEQRVICGCEETTDADASGRAHVHTDSCYEDVLICGIEEHEHSLICYSDPTADVEGKTAWNNSVSAVTLTGVWSDDIVAIAESQIGYSESTKNYTVTEAGDIKGYSRYGSWYGDAYGDWDAMFVAFCLNYSRIPRSYMPYDSSCERWVELLSSQEFDYHSANSYVPAKGDIAFFDIDSDGVSDHIGIVSAMSEKKDVRASYKLRVIEGDSSDRVQYVTYDANDACILGFGKLPENPRLADRDNDEFELTADSDNGVCIHLSGSSSSLPFPADEISMTVEKIVNDDAAALVDAAVADTLLENGELYLFDIRLWHEGMEIEPIGPVALSFDGVACCDENEIAGVFHVDEENEQATDMNAEITADGSVVIDTDHFSLYGVVIAGSGNITITQNLEVTWDEINARISELVFTVSSATDKVSFHVEYSDDEGSNWMNAVTSSETAKNTPVALNASDALENAPIGRIFRVYGYKDKNNYGYTASIALDDILNKAKPGFSDWLENSYVQDFNGTALPETLQELYSAFAVYYALPVLEIKTRMDGSDIYVYAETDEQGSYTYSWEYKDEDGNWVSLCDDTTDSINSSAIDILLSGGKYVRCRMYENGKIKATSSSLFVNPLRQAYDNAIEEINSGLNLGDLAINGTKFKDYFYYGNAAKDSRVPFYNASSYADYLAKCYLDAGGGAAGLNAVRREWDYYLYDIYDPTEKSNTVVYPAYTYGDTDLEWPKDSTSSFHGTGTLLPIINDLDYSFLENGVDYSNFVSGLNKTATAVMPGDANTEREYDIDIIADAQAKARGPVAMILQIQTSWQMFDMEHANALQGDGYTKVGSVANNTELATLYDIKHALLRFVDYMEKNYPGNNLVIGITEVQHAKSQTMFSGTDKSGKPLYVTNDYDILRNAILAWDSFGNCEHVHYDTDALVNATTNLASNLYGWKDFYGNDILYTDIQKVAVIIGGPTENSNSTNGYGCTLPWKTFQSASLNSVYSIRTNNGTSNGSGVISWLDNAANNTGDAFCDGNGTTFTDKFVATTEDAVFSYLVQIAEKEMAKKGIDVTAEDKYVDNVAVSDTISDEFILDTTEPIIATVYNKDGSEYSKTTVELDDPNLSITMNDDGTTTVDYLFGTVYNTKKCVLHFRIRAKDDYIGSNNVYSNLGTPDLYYTHKKLDSAGNLTGEEDNYQVNCYDTPQVNVPIRFTTVDGEAITILVGESVDLADLSKFIAQNAEDLVDNYYQINGTLSYTWVLPDGTEVPAGSVNVLNGSIGEQSFPDRSSIFMGNVAGQYTGTLKVTFSPGDVDSSNRNFSDEDTAVPVEPLTNPGNVWINVVADDSTERFFVRKDWVGGVPEGIGSIKFRILDKDGNPVLDENEDQLEYELSAENNWTVEVSGLPSVIDGVIQSYTVEEIDGPEGYHTVYSVESLIEEDWAAKVTLSFTPSKTKDKVELQINFTYNGKEKTYSVTSKEKYESGKTYLFYVEDLPIDEYGEPFACEIISIININDNNAPLEVSSKSATAEKYLRGSTNTEVKVITNIPAYELPSTGSSGTMLYIAFGAMMMLCAALTAIYFMKKRKSANSTGR